MLVPLRRAEMFDPSHPTYTSRKYLACDEHETVARAVPIPVGL